MKYLKVKLVGWLILCGFFISLVLSVRPAEAAEGLVPTAANNLQIGLRRRSDLVATDSGYMRVFYRGKTVGIEYYDNSFNIRSKKTIPMELDMWGGFYAGKDAYYLVEGQPNKDENDTAEVIRVIRYDTAWNKTGAANITGNPELFGGEVRYPFDYGCVEFAERNGILYIVTGHEGYVDSMYGQGHQGFLMIAVNTSSMTGKIVDCDLWHSFAQYIKSKDSDLYVLEQSEGSRFTKLTRYNADTMESQSVPVLRYGGSRDSAWAVACYASVDGMALSSDHVLCLGTSIDQSQYDTVSEDTAHNIYLTVTPVSDFSETATEVKWLTNYSGGGKSFLGTKITKINDNRFMISWEEYGTSGSVSEDDVLSSSILHYVFVDGSGNKISGEYTEATPISDCQPIVKDSKVVYYASNRNTVDFYSIDSETGKTSKKVYHVAGENATWNLTGNVLTISGTGAMSIDSEEDFRTPISSTSYGYSYTSTEEANWTAISDKVEKVVVKTGITSIPDFAFANLSKLKEVVIEPGVKSIGAKAFYNCKSLEKITIPASVQEIGDDILWTGYYWTWNGTHVVYASIYTEDNSAAVEYAKKNDIDYYVSIAQAEVSGLKTSYTYAGKKVEPKLTIKLGDHILTKDTDYKVTYRNNDKAGTAVAEVSGIHQYTGTIKVKYKITLPAAGKKLTDSKTKNVYTITKKGSAVALSGTKSSKLITLTVPSKVILNGVSYKVTSITDYAFKNNKKLKKVVISGNVTSIGTGAFQGCVSLQNLKIGSKVNKIGTKAFYNCTKLVSIEIQPAKLTSKSIGSHAFANVGKSNYKKLSVSVPKGKKSAYKKLLAAKGLSSKAKIK